MVYPSLWIRIRLSSCDLALLVTSLCFIAPCLTALSGCAWQPELLRPTVALPEYRQTSGASIQPQPQREWWQGYGSTELIRLFDALQLDNLELATAKARIVQVRALLGQQRASNWPSVDAQLDARNSRSLAVGESQNESQNSSGLDFSVGYEVDLWGSRSAAELGAKLSVISRQQEYQSQLLQLQAALAQNYFELLALRERHVIAQQNMQASQELLTLMQLRFEAGSASGIELNQQRNTWLATRSQALGLARAVLNRERLLAVLLGRNLNTLLLGGKISDLTLPPVSIVQPAALLEFRPDIQMAESQWRISEAALYQEKTKRWPGLNLRAGLGIVDVLGGGESWLGTVAGSLTAPLFDSGRIRNQIAVAEAELGIAELSYRKTVLIAMQDALETLSELSYQRSLLTVRMQELENNRRLYDLAKLRYDSGDTDFINLLTAQRSWFSARDSLIQAKNDQLLATVNVFRAMGVAPMLADH